jgi:hypothetical protein
VPSRDVSAQEHYHVGHESVLANMCLEHNGTLGCVRDQNHMCRHITSAFLECKEREGQSNRTLSPQQRPIEYEVCRLECGCHYGRVSLYSIRRHERAKQIASYELVDSGIRERIQLGMQGKGPGAPRGYCRPAKESSESK